MAGPLSYPRDEEQKSLPLGFGLIEVRHLFVTVESSVVTSFVHFTCLNVFCRTIHLSLDGSVIGGSF